MGLKELMTNPEMIKLMLIVIPALFILVVGSTIQRKVLAKKKAAQEQAMANYTSPNQQATSSGDEQMKNYITQYKSQYPRDSLKSALISSGHTEAEVDDALNKYF